MFEPTREQLAAAEALALKNASVRCHALTEQDGDLLVTVTGFPEPMGFTTRAPRVHDLTINVNGCITMGVAA